MVASGFASKDYKSKETGIKSLFRIINGSHGSSRKVYKPCMIMLPIQAFYIVASIVKVTLVQFVMVFGSKALDTIYRV